MTTTFTGEVRIPGSIENGLPSTITLDAQTLVLTAGGTELGRWNRNDLKLRREPDGSFHLTLGREVVLFNPDSPLEFAILSGMPGAGTAATPAPVSPTDPAPQTVTPVAPVAEQPAVPAAAEPSPVQPIAPAADPAPSPPAPAPAPATPPPSPSMPPPTPQSSPSAPPPAPESAVPPIAAPPAAAPPAAAPPAAAPETQGVPPAVPPATAPPPTAPQPAAAPAPAAPPAPPARVAFQLEERLDPEAIAQATPQPEAPPAVPVPRRAAGASTDFWDDFYAEEQEASAMPTPPVAAPAPQEVAETPVEPAAGFQLQDDADEAAAEERAGGYGSGLFSEDDDKAADPPAFGGDTGDSEDRSWSYYDEEDGGTDRGWSYGDDAVEETTEEPPAFRSPVADREDLIDTSLGSRIAGFTSWRPSLPSFSFGSSELGMKARDALSVLDAILEENDTEDIPKALIIGLGGFAALLGVVAVLVVLFG